MMVTTPGHRQPTYVGRPTHTLDNVTTDVRSDSQVRIYVAIGIIHYAKKSQTHKVVKYKILRTLKVTIFRETR